MDSVNKGLRDTRKPGNGIRKAELPLRSSCEIQGNILEKFPEENQAFILFGFSDPVPAKRWLKSLLPEISTTALLTRDVRKSAGQSYCALGLTYHGFAILSAELVAELEPFKAFCEGPALRAPKLRDSGPSDPNQWIFGGPSRAQVHAVITLASKRSDSLELAIAKHRAIGDREGLQILHIEIGGALPGAMAGHEHFGFRDGISQPSVRGFDIPPDSKIANANLPALPAGEFILGHPRYGTNCDRDAWPCPKWMYNGSFQVLKRLNQDVAGWRGQLTRVSQSISHQGLSISENTLAAKLIGRWPSGASLSKAPHKDSGSDDETSIDFHDDPFGLKTPRFAHVRKMRPGGKLIADREWRRIIRRSIPFGPVYDQELDFAAVPPIERGLLMNAFMANIEQQFEFLLRGWAHDPDFPEAGDGPDPLIGEDSSQVALRSDDGARYSFSMKRFVHTSGAVYAFVPSLTAIKKISSL